MPEATGRGKASAFFSRGNLTSQSLAIPDWLGANSNFSFVSLMELPLVMMTFDVTRLYQAS